MPAKIQAMKREGDTATETLVSIKELLPQYRKKKGVGLQDETTKSILDEYTAAKALGEQWSQIYREVARYCQPSNSNYNNVGDRNAGENQFGKIWTSEGINLIKRASDYIIQRAMPKGVEWWNLSPTREFINDKNIDDENKRMLVADTKRESGKLRKIIERSNFRQMARRSARDFLTFGISALYIKSEVGNLAAGIPPKLHFESLPINTYYLSPAPGSDKVGVFWERKWIVRNWLRSMPHIPLPENVVNNKEQNEIVIVQGIRPLVGGGYLHVVFIEGKKEIIYSEKMEFSPIVVARQIAAAGETYPSASFGFQALPTLQSLNSLEANHLRALALAVNPPLLVTNGLESTQQVRLEPGARLLVNRNVGSSNPDIAQLQTQDRTSSSTAAIEKLKQSLLESVAINKQLPTSGTPASATEIIAAQNQERNALSGIVDDYIELCLIPIIKASFQEGKKLQVIDPGVSDGDARYSLTVIGDTEEQEKSSRIQKLQALSELSIQFANAAAGPAGSKINIDRFFDAVTDSLGINDLLNTKDEELEIERQKQEARQAAIAQQQQAAAQ